MHRYYLDACLADEVDHDEVQNDVSEDEVSKATLRTDGAELDFVLRIDLKTETDTEHKGGDTRDESREEGVEGEGTDQAAIDELEDSSEEDVGEIGINNLEFLGGVGGVLFIKLANDSSKSGHFQMLSNLLVVCMF